MQDQYILCSDLSKSVDEPIYGSAPQTVSWLLLEYPGGYGAKAFEESDLSDEIKHHMTSVQKSLPHPRLLLIKKRNERLDRKINFYLAFSEESSPRMFHLELSTYDELLNIDYASMLAGDKSARDHLHTDPIVVVCTNGKRDRCCAKFGQPLFDAVYSYTQEGIWQTSHVGGHRFAANMVCLPHGIYYGRIPPEQGPRVVDAYRSRSLALEYYRGRACYTPVQQAAEYTLRAETGLNGIDGFRLEETDRLDDDHWKITFRSSSGIIYQLRLQHELSDDSIYESCNTPEKRVQFSLYHLQEIKVV